MAQDIIKEISSCPNSPNCVSTVAHSPVHHMAPWSYEGEMQAIMSVVKEAILKEKRVTLAGSGENHFHFIFTSCFFRFKDDVWIYFDDATKQIHFKSASRKGYSDLGVNRKRMQRLKKQIF